MEMMWVLPSAEYDLTARLKNCLHARRDLLIVREIGGTWFGVYTGSEGNHHFLATPKNSRRRTFFPGVKHG